MFEGFEDRFRGVAELLSDLSDGESIAVQLSDVSIFFHREHPCVPLRRRVAARKG
jgi:hypothetical protein